MADQVLYSGVACITDLMVKEGLINLDFADVRAVMREMGKAMMGTGEASGEKRALRSAEAAIANPLIDDVSMKGARGLLISITGGKDLTLYEVDEAATRIREEVDQEANIIVGATFDETLEGIIRVSVVATGIDTIAHAQRPPADNNRLAELTQRLRVDTQRIAAERVEHAQPHAQVQPPQARAMQPAPVAPPVAAAQPPAPRPSFEHAAAAAVAAALQPQQSTIDDVTVRSITPKPSLFVEPVMAEPAPQDMPKSFIPPEPERARAPRMPRIDELPMPAQNQLRARQGEPVDAGPEKQRMSLLQRLAQVGLGRRDDSDAHAEAPVQAERPAMPPLPPRQPPRMPDPVSEYAKRPQAPAAPQGAPQGLDIHGRQALPVHKSVDDDQLEIPAFLRRQAN
jgi:cell division protein FtsZ